MAQIIIEKGLTRINKTLNKELIILRVILKLSSNSVIGISLILIYLLLKPFN